jgi:putative endonuclease
MTDARRELGAKGEAAALAYLRRRGLRLLHRNLRLGRLGELDLVMCDRDLLVIVEVKSKVTGDLGGFENITYAKQLKLSQLAQMYLQNYPAQWKDVRLDAVEVEYASAKDPSPVIRHLPDAFRAG